MGFGSNGAVALRRERLQAADVFFSTDIAKLTTYRSADVGGWCLDPRRSGPRNLLKLAPQLLSLLLQKNMPKRSPILIRIFKEESELEVWKQDTTGRFELPRDQYRLPKCL